MTITYWHRELPPLDGEPVEEHVVEADSLRVEGTLSHRDELWTRCYDDLMAVVRDRLAQEVVRLGGDYAHVLDEHVEVKRNDALRQAWLHGRFTYVLYRRPAVAPRAP